MLVGEVKVVWKKQIVSIILVNQLVTIGEWVEMLFKNSKRIFYFKQ